MQTTQNTANRHTERLVNRAASEEDGGEDVVSSKEPTEEGLNIISDLINDEATLRKQAEHLDTEAQKLENDGDSTAKEAAAQLRAQSSNALTAASEIGSIITEIKNDPHKKLSRRTINGLKASSMKMIGECDQEIEHAETTHHAVVDHKENLRRSIETQEHKSEKKLTPKPPAKPKPTKKTSAEKIDDPDIQARLEHERREREAALEHEENEHHAKRAKMTEKAASVVRKVKKVAKGIWHGVCETAEDIGEGVSDAFHHGVDAVKHAAHVVTHAAPVMAMVKMGGKMLHAMAHPLETASRVIHKLGNIKNALLGILPDHPGHDESPAIESGIVTVQVAIAPRSAPLMLNTSLLDQLAGLNLPKLRAEHVEQMPTHSSSLVLVSQHPDTIPYLPFLTRS